MSALEIPRLITTAALSQITGRHHGAIQRLVALGQLVPSAILEEKQRSVLLFTAADAGLVAVLLDTTTTTTPAKSRLTEV